jgi:hypothetical protein
MTTSRSFEGRSAWVLVGVLALAGCASAPTTSKAVAPRFVGVWANADSGPSWVEIQSHSVVSFGVTQSNGRCASAAADILAKNRVNVPVSALGNGEMSLKLDGRTLVVTGRFGTQRYLPSSRESICQGPSGKYLPGAPYAKSG